MKKGVVFTPKTRLGIPYVEFKVNPRYKIDIFYPDDVKPYEHKYLSWENLSYAYPTPGKNEEDDYLLNHALQDEKKTSVMLFTRTDVNKIASHYNDKYEIVPMPFRDDYKLIYVLRQGCLSDYFNSEEIDDKYTEYGFDLNIVLLQWMMHTPMKDLVNGNLILKDEPYSPLIDVEGCGTKASHAYGPVGAVISGLLFGYPIESTVSLINDCAPAFYNF